jgi:hypothetical protein
VRPHRGRGDAFGDCDILYPRAGAATLEQAFHMGQATSAEQGRFGVIGAPQTGFRPVNLEGDGRAARRQGSTTAARGRLFTRALPRASRARVCG